MTAGADDLHSVELLFVDSEQKAEQFRRWLSQRRDWLAVDTETIGLEWWRSGFLRLVQVGDEQTGWAFPAERTDLIRCVRQAAAELPLVAHNANFDRHALREFDWPAMHDTKIMHALVHPEAPSHALKPIAASLWPQARTGEGWLKTEMRRNGWTWATVPIDHPAYWAYGALDTVLCARLAAMLWRELRTSPALLQAYEREKAVANVAWWAEERGVRLDIDYTTRLLAQWTVVLQHLKEVLQNYGIENPNARRQIISALEENGIRLAELTPSGEPKLDKAVLEGIDHTIAETVLEYRRLAKWKATYLEGFLIRHDDGVLHPNINTLEAKTGRMSITEPPLQTLPRGEVIRNCIVPTPGRVLLTADYDAMEYRMFASLVNDPQMTAALLVGKDPHLWAASLVWGIPEERVTKEQRQIAKNIQYGILYGAGPHKIAEVAGVPYPVAERAVRMYHAALPSVSGFTRRLEAQARARPLGSAVWVETFGGRRVAAPVEYAYKLVNYLIQGSCADVLKDKLIALHEQGVDILLPVHDEVLVECDSSDAAEVARVMTETLTETRTVVPLTVSVSNPLKTWGEKYAVHQT
jgi:DNA polymerase-1